MSDSLGTLFVDLVANTAKFVSPLTDAAQTAKRVARDISNEFAGLQRVASQTFGAFGQFNPIVSELGFAFQEAGRAAAEAMGNFAKIPNALGGLAAFGAGYTAMLSSASIGALTLAAHSAEAAAKLYELSQATGVSTETLSGLGFAAKQFGVSQESLAAGLERMDRSADAAARAPVGAINAWTRLKVTVTDSSGQLKPTEVLFSDLVAKLSTMGNSAEKTALEVEIFGRSAGPELANMIDHGNAAIQGWVTTARSMGMVVSEEEAKAAEHFEQTLGVLSGVFEGMANKLTIALLPTLQVIADAVEEDLGKGPNLSWIVNMTREFVAAAADMIEMAKLVNAAVNDMASGWSAPVERFKKEWAEKGTALGPLQKPNALVNLVGSELLGDYKGKGESYDDYKKRVMKEHDDFIDKLSHPPELKEPETPKRNAPPAAPGGGLAPVIPKDSIAELVAKLQAETTAEIALANASGLGAAALAAQKAAGEADVAIAEKRTELLDRERSLREQLANSRTNQQGTEVARIQAEISGVQQLLTELDKDTPQIRNLYLQLAAAKEATQVGTNLAKENLDTDREIASLRDLVAAYQTGGRAIAEAGIDKQLAKEKEDLAELRKLFADTAANDPLANVPGPVGHLASLADLAATIDANSAALERRRALLLEERSLNIDDEIEKETRAFRDQQSVVSGLNEAYLKSAAAVREAQIDIKIGQYIEDNPVASEAAIARKREIFQKESDAAWQNATAQEAAQYELGRAYQDTLERLRAIRSELVAHGQSTILVDVAISQGSLDSVVKYRQALFEANNEGLLGAAKLYEQQRQLDEEFDRAATEVGTLSQRYRALLDQIRLEGANPLGQMFDDVGKSINSLSGELARLIITGKNGFKEWAQQLGESLLKTQIQGMLSGLASLALKTKQQSQAEQSGLPNFGSSLEHGPKAPGLFGALESGLAKVLGISPEGSTRKPTGAMGDPVHVLLDGGLPGAEGQGNSGGLENIWKSLGAPGTGTTPPFFPVGGPSFFAQSPLAFGDTSGQLPLDRTSSGNFGLPEPLPDEGGDGQGSGIGELGKLFHSIESGIGGIAHAIGSGVEAGASGIASFFTKIFGGFLAQGGDVTQGKAYVVGENHPEFFVPKQAGSVVPTLKFGSGGGGAQHIHTTVNINVPPGTHPDSWRRSQGQVMSEAYAHMAAAHARNR